MSEQEPGEVADPNLGVPGEPEPLPEDDAAKEPDPLPEDEPEDDDPEDVQEGVTDDPGTEGESVPLAEDNG